MISVFSQSMVNDVIIDIMQIAESVNFNKLLSAYRKHLSTETALGYLTLEQLVVQKLEYLSCPSELSIALRRISRTIKACVR